MPKGWQHLLDQIVAWAVVIGALSLATIAVCRVLYMLGV